MKVLEAGCALHYIAMLLNSLCHNTGFLICCQHCPCLGFHFLLLLLLVCVCVAKTSMVNRESFKLPENLPANGQEKGEGLVSLTQTARIAFRLLSFIMQCFKLRESPTSKGSRS